MPHCYMGAMHATARVQACTKQPDYDPKTLVMATCTPARRPTRGRAIRNPCRTTRSSPPGPLRTKPGSLVVCGQCPPAEKELDHQAAPAISDPIKGSYGRIHTGEHGHSSEGLSAPHEPLLHGRGAPTSAGAPGPSRERMSHFSQPEMTRLSL